MLISLRVQPPDLLPFQEDPFALLLDCHGRIRTFLGLAQRLAGATAPSDAAVTDAARRLVRYFTLGFGKHVADEDLSLARRLRALPLSTEVRPQVKTALAQMEAEHRTIDAQVERLLERWRVLETQPARLGELAPSLRADTEALAPAMEAHLLLEERVLFPVAGSLLPAPEVQALREEMRARRTAPPSPP